MRLAFCRLLATDPRLSKLVSRALIRYQILRTGTLRLCGRESSASCGPGFARPWLRARLTWSIQEDIPGSRIQHRIASSIGRRRERRCGAFGEVSSMHKTSTVADGEFLVEGLQAPAPNQGDKRIARRSQPIHLRITSILIRTATHTSANTSAINNLEHKEATYCTASIPKMICHRYSITRPLFASLISVSMIHCRKRT